MFRNQQSKIKSKESDTLKIACFLDLNYFFFFFHSREILGRSNNFFKMPKFLFLNTRELFSMLINFLTCHCLFQNNKQVYKREQITSDKYMNKWSNQAIKVRKGQVRT